MKKNLYIIAALLLSVGSIMAQPQSAGAPRLFIKAGHNLMAPVWSPDGSSLAVTGDNYTGIWVAKADGSDLSQLTDEAGAGYKMLWTSDSKSIIARTDQLVENRRFHEVKSIDVATRNVKTIVGRTRSLTGTPTLKNITAKTVTTNAYEIMMNNPVKATEMIAGLADYAGKMVINPALSPNGVKVAFQIPGKGAFVCDVNGNNVRSIGQGSYASWLPDSRYVVVSRIKDDGNIFTSAELYAIDTNNGEATVLESDSKLIPITHAVSPDGKKVAFENSADGNIYIMDLK